MEIIFRAAYGSSKDISVYQSLDLTPGQIYIVGKVWKKQQISLATVINFSLEQSFSSSTIILTGNL